MCCLGVLEKNETEREMGRFNTPNSSKHTNLAVDHIFKTQRDPRQPGKT